MEPKNVQVEWSKKSEDCGDRANLLRGEIELREELDLAPVKPGDVTNNPAESWRKSGGSGKRGGRELPEDIDRETEAEELILAPRGPREGQVAQSASWQRQSGGELRCGLSVALQLPVDLLCLFLEPSWGQGRGYSTEQEELKLSPRDVRRPQKRPPDWGKQSANPLRSGGSTAQEEELILSPKEVVIVCVFGCVAFLSPLSL